jgi:hypothetical protein
MSEDIHLHPLVFTLQNAIEGCGFLAGITITGKAVMERDDNGEWWMYGVRPGAIAAGGNTPNEAFLNFKNRYKEVLFDFAEECEGFAEFENVTESFFNAEDLEEEARWGRALEAVRRNDSALPEPFNELPRRKAEEVPVGIQIERLEDKSRKQFKPTNNIQDSMAQAA